MDSQSFMSAGILITMLLVMIGIGVLICFLVYNVYSSVPAQFQQIPPGQVWLLLVPIVSIIMNFIVYPKISESYKLYAQSKGMDDGTDFGLSLGKNYAIAMVIGLFCGIAGLVGLILFIMWLVKMYDYKKRLA